MAGERAERARRACALSVPAECAHAERAVHAHAETMAKFFGGNAAKGLAHIGQAFKRIDVDGSGTLTWDEFERFVNTR